ncbi:hypothetical protein [Halomicronema sp. CCY15110]|uniref:hypothetical protein n=1 Tax=Halomicronema sp. CCY15110 TaxID=2767773 RepID=UPI00194F2303|nr:hypothetical protein [Halomicronema sp. CCY15110]
MAALAKPPWRIAVEFHRWVAARRGRGGPGRSPRPPVLKRDRWDEPTQARIFYA